MVKLEEVCGEIKWMLNDIASKSELKKQKELEVKNLEREIEILKGRVQESIQNNLIVKEKDTK